MIRQPRHGYYALAGNRDEAGFSPRQWIPASGTALRAMGIVAEESGHTAGLHAAVLTDVPVQVCVGCVDNPGGIPQEASLGIPRRLGEDAAGQAILAYLDLPHPRPGERAAVRLRGWAASSGPVSGSQMVAVPILRFGVPVGAVSLTAPADTMPSSGVPAGVRALKRAAGLLQRGAGRSCA
ncbi:hypothetical protein ACIGFK_19635 [Streptomyces sp. NPDC085524]|uniref:hypothetical protein n=1 Tax=unclassified Streptomyces TaxID=2593676 RepID=UPI0035D7E5DD